MMMFCGNCGTKADDKDKFCNECGNPLNETTKEQKENIEETKVLEEPEKSQNELPVQGTITEDQKANGFANIINQNNNVQNTNYNNMPNNMPSNMPMPMNYNNGHYNYNAYNNYNNAYNNQGGIPNNGNYSSNYQYKSNNKAKKIVLILLGILLFVFIVLGLLFIFKGNNVFSGGNGKGKKTIMIYVVGSDLESKLGAASADIEEMIESDADFDDINLLLYTGGAKRWYNGDIPDDKNAIFRVTEDGLELVEEFDKENMATYKPLQEFLDYGYKHYKADSYSLIFWDHGGGPIYGFGSDEYHSKDTLTLTEIEKALSKSEFNGNRKLELIGFDACLMSTVEIAYVFSDYAKYFVASQEAEPSDGWDYDFLSEIDEDTTTEEMGKIIIDYYSKYYNGKFGGSGISLSLLNLNKIENLEKGLNDLFGEVDDNLNVDFSKISRTREKSKTYGQSSAQYYDLVDIYDLVDRLPSNYYEKVDKVKSAIEDLVVYQKTDLKYTNGLSIYFPYSYKEAINYNISQYKKFDFADEYTEFISNFGSKLTGKRLHNWKLTEEVPVSEKKGEISVTVPKEVIENYSKINYVIFEKMDNNYYMPIYKGTDVEINGNTISTTIADKALVATIDNGEKVNMTAIESEVGKDYVKYIIPGALQRWTEGSFSDFEMIGVYVNLIVDEENPNGRVDEVVAIQNMEESSLLRKTSIDIKEWDLIQLLTYKYKIFDAQGNYTSNWEGSGEVTGIEAHTDETLQLEFEDLDISRDYYCLFKIADSQGNEYTTNVVKVK